MKRIAVGIILQLGLAALAATTVPAQAQPPTTSPRTVVTLSDSATAQVRRLAIQHNGRTKPFDSFARQTLKSITGSPSIKGQDSVVTVLSIIAYPDAWQDEPLVEVPFRPLRAKLGMEPRQAHISYNDLVASRKLMRLLPPIVQKQQQDEKLTMLEQETMDAFERFVALSNLLQQKLPFVPAASGDPVHAVWSTIVEPEGYSPEQQQALRGAWTAFLDAVRSGSDATMSTAAQSLSAALRAANPSVYPAAWRLNLEVLYNRAAPFRAARVLYALAIVLLALGLNPSRPRAGTWGLGVLVAAFALHAGDIATRVVLGGRPPVSNFYETMLWLPLVAVTVALIFERIYRVRYFGIAASTVAVVMLTLADYVPLDSSISPVVAVLRSNLWLTIHVLTIVASYGALMLATVLAHIYALSFLARRQSAAALASLELFLYRAIQVGIVLLASGIMLGAVWANASWGRYWGWDPKETWALITLLWFLAMLHGRFMGWLKGIGLAVGTIGGFFLLLMTYYGVSFYLVGLHSYAGGHAKPVPPLLIGYVLAELTFLVIVVTATIRRSSAHP